MILEQLISCLTKVSTDESTDNYFLVPGTRVPVCAEVVSHMCKAYRVVGA